MPHKNSVQVFPIPNKIRKNEIPITKCIDWINSIDVRLLDHPSPETIRKAMYIFQRATWGRDLNELLSFNKTSKDLEKATKLAIEGKTLSLNIEIPHFTFAIGGVSRITTHQIVRDRIGVTYSQRCTGDQDCRHDDILVPRCLTRNPEILERYINNSIEAKMVYAEATDLDYPQSIQVMRYVLPQNLAQYILESASLTTWASIIGKRGCTNESLEYNIIVKKVADQIVEIFPEFKNLLKPYCDRPGGCFLMKGHSPLNGNIYTPDEKHEYDYNKENFMYPYTKMQLVDGPEFKTRYFEGIKEINKNRYDQLAKKYLVSKLHDFN